MLELDIKALHLILDQTLIEIENKSYKNIEIL